MGKFFENYKDTLQSNIFEIIQANLALSQAAWNDLLRSHSIWCLSDSVMLNFDMID